MLHLTVHMKRDRNSCVMNEKLKPFSHLQSLREVGVNAGLSILESYRNDECAHPSLIHHRKGVVGGGMQPPSSCGSCRLVSAIGKELDTVD